MKKIGFIITTFLRDDLYVKSIKSLLKFQQDNWEIIVIDQGIDRSKELLVLPVISTKLHYFEAPFNSGLSYCRNYGIKIAKTLDCDYVFIGSDSFLFNESIENLNEIIKYLEKSKHSFCGFELTNSVCGWEAKLNLIECQSFELDFVDKNHFQHVGIPPYSPEQFCKDDSYTLLGNVFPFWNVDICRNVFLAKTEMLDNVKWDENLKLCEHEDMFWRIKQAGYTGIWTNYIVIEKMTDRPDEYAEFRKRNFREGQKKLQAKYGIKGWVTYKNLDRAKDYYARPNK